MAASTDNDKRIALFQSIGLNEQKARETLKNPDVTRVLETTINEVHLFSFSFIVSTGYHLGENDLRRRECYFQAGWQSSLRTIDQKQTSNSSPPSILDQVYLRGENKK